VLNRSVYIRSSGNSRQKHVESQCPWTRNWPIRFLSGGLCRRSISKPIGVLLKQRCSKPANSSIAGLCYKCFRYPDSRLGGKTKSPSARAWCQATFLSITRSGPSASGMPDTLAENTRESRLFARKESSDVAWAHAICSIGAVPV
jgi:hypothetical protein